MPDQPLLLSMIGSLLASSELSDSFTPSAALVLVILSALTSNTLAFMPAARRR